MLARVWLREKLVGAKTTSAFAIALATVSGGSSPSRVSVGYPSR